jgi:hypothetical protein
MNIETNIVEIYYFADDFSKEYSKMIKNSRLVPDDGKKHRDKPSKQPHVEEITILVAFHLGEFRNLKPIYRIHIRTCTFRYALRRVDS